jgi:pimeloyl-ACP methyl ester carboxylesterase
MNVRRLLGTAAASFDRAVVAAIQLRNRSVRAQAEKLSHDERLARLAEIRAIYGEPRFLDEPDLFFTPPGKIEPTVRPVRPRVLDLSWPSGYAPFGEAVRALYLSHERNHIAHARLFHGERKGRPAVILIHGYMAGQWNIEERAWPVEWLVKRGLDVAIMVLPFHALRGRSDRAPAFPGADPRFTNEGFRQAMGDLRGLVGWLKDRGAPIVGVMGMSLGGYTTSLAATLDHRLGFAVPIIPLASIADFARDQGRLGDGEQMELQHAALEAANWVVSPLARKAKVPSDRILVIGAEADQITPMAHAERLASHFDARLLRLPGGHLLQFGRGDAFREVGKMLRRLGVID